MDQQKAKILINLLKASSSDKVVKGLQEIKRRLQINVDNLNIFRSLGLVPETLRLIQRPNADIIKGVLSVLSGCCTNEAIRSEVYNVGGMTHMVNVLKCVKSEALQQRACRTVANQALHQPSCDTFIRLEAIEVIIEILINCKEDMTKMTAIRALRLLANSGEHCQRIVMRKGILHICSSGLGSEANPPNIELLRCTLKAIAHFSRVSHRACVNQIMEGTGNMMSLSKISDSEDIEIYGYVLRTILNIVRTCFESTTHKYNALNAKMLLHLCTARAPTIIVFELQNRRVIDIEEEKLIVALCKFCEGFSLCSSWTDSSYCDSQLFMERAWFQLKECGGVAMLVSLLITHRHHAKLRPALLKAILGIEHSYSGRDTILKYLLAANLLPQLAEQFDELMAEYRQVRRDSQPESCVHTIKTLGPDKKVELEGLKGGKEELEVNGNQNKRGNQIESGEEQVQTAENKSDGSAFGEIIRKENPTSLMVLESSNSTIAMEAELSNSDIAELDVDSLKSNSSSAQEETSNIENLEYNSYCAQEETSDVVNLEYNSSSAQEEISTHGITKSNHSFVKENARGLYDTPFLASQENSIFNNSRNPGMYINPTSHRSLSCSPQSNQTDSGSSHGSPSWSPTQGRSESPTFSPPSISHPFSSRISIDPKVLDFTPSSSPISQDTSPPLSPVMHSPPRSTSPIRVPSDWDYDDEDEIEQSADGRFSPIVYDTKCNDSDGNKEEIDELIEVTVNNSKEMCQDRDSSKAVPNSTDLLKNNVNLNEDQSLMENIDEKLVITSTSGKRLRDSSNPTCLNVDVFQEKKMKCDLQTPNESKNLDVKQSTSIASTDMMTEEVQPTRSLVSSDIDTEKGIATGADAGKTPFVKLNQIIFRVRKKGHVKRHTCTIKGETKSDVYCPVKELQKSQKDQQQEQEQQQTTLAKKSNRICKTPEFSALNTEEVQRLELLELVVRVISLIARVKEAIKPVCLEFVPRIMTYLSTARVIHKSATRMLVTIAKNPLCIQPLLDSNFIPYVGVELGEAGDPESPNGCSQCHILSEGAVAFLEEIVRFFSHIHQYGKVEVINRLHPSREHSVREDCAMALPHITRCPKLLHDFMVRYSSIDLLMSVLHSKRPPNDASYMYATAAISKLATTLQLDKQYKPVLCTLCLHRGNHTLEEVEENSKMQPKKAEKLKHNGTVDSFSDLSEVDVKLKDCKWKLDETKDVTFKLDDGSTVSANREFLAEKNEVLRGMLMGSFVESGSNFVEMPKISKMSLEILIHFLYGCQCDLMEKGDLQTYIDLIFLSEMYMVEKLHSFSLFNMMSTINNVGDIIRIYESGVGRIDENIFLHALCVVLVRPMKTWKRALWMKGLFESIHAEDISHTIRMIIYHPLDMNRLICNCRNLYL